MLLDGSDTTGVAMAAALKADECQIFTDVDGVYLDWGTPQQQRLGQVTPDDLAGYQFAAGSMGPKVEAAARFVAKTGGRAAIGSLADIAGIVAGIVLSFLTRRVIMFEKPVLRLFWSNEWVLRASVIAIVGALAGALYPALKAAQRDPIDALAYE